MKDKFDTRGKYDWNSDGVTGYTQGANPRSNFITDHMGRTLTVLFVIGAIIIASIVIGALNERDDELRTQAEEQQAAGR